MNPNAVVVAIDAYVVIYNGHSCSYLYSPAFLLSQNTVYILLYYIVSYQLNCNKKHIVKVKSTETHLATDWRATSAACLQRWLACLWSIHSFHGLPNAAWIAFIVGQQFASGGRADPIQEIMRIKIKIKDQKAKAILGLDSWARPAVTTII